MNQIIRVDANLFRITYGFTSSDNTRYYLNGVYVEPHPCGGVNLVATDGHRMMVVYDRTGAADSPVIVQLSKEALRACKPKGTKYARDCRVLTVAPDGLATVYSSADGAEIIVATSKDSLVDGSYPDWRRVLPTGYGQHTGWFNPRLVADFAKAGEDLGAHFDKARHFKMAGGDDGGPCLIRFVSIPEAVGVLMPVRGEDISGLPEFINARPYENPRIILSRMGGESFELIVHRSPMADAERRRFTFPNAHATRRAYNRLLAGLQARGMAQGYEPIAPVHELDRDYVERLKQRAKRLEEAREAFTTAEETDIARPWRRAVLTQAAQGKALSNVIPFLPAVSESGGVAALYDPHRKAA